jgi:glycosyltransferase involved in cell wall biosynthesis
MKIAVITPYYKEPIAFLRQCHESVISQGIEVDHFFIADGFPNAELMSWNIKHISLSEPHQDNGNTPRGIGAMLASAEGYDFIAFLDADNWFHPNHIHSMVELWKKTQADVCCSFTSIHTLDGDEMVGLQASDQLTFQHVDTSCYFMHRDSFASLSMWLDMPKKLSPVCDRIFLAGLKHRKYKIAFTQLRSVAFRSQYKADYLAAKIPPPLNAKENVADEAEQYLLSLDGVRETVSRLGFYPL